MEILKVKKVTFGMLAIAVVAMALASVTLVPPVTASVKPATQITTSYGQDFVVNYNNVTIWLDGEDSTILAGQVIQFYNATGGDSGKVILEGISGDAEDYTPSPTGSDGRLETTLKTGKYEVRCDDPSCGCIVTNITVSSVDMELKLRSGTKTISEIPQGTRIKVKFTHSLDPNDGVFLKLTDPNGDTMKVKSGVVFGDCDNVVNVDHITDLEISTVGWELGTYKFKVCTEERYARGLDKDSNEVELEIISSEIKIVAKKTEIVQLEKVKLTVTGKPGCSIEVFVERGAEHAIFPGGTNDNPGTRKGYFTDDIDGDGKREYAVYFDKIGSYTVKVRDLDTTPPTVDFVDITVSKQKVTFHMPETCAIGADLVVNGTANTGKTVDVAIDDIIVKVDVDIDTKGKFEVKLPTPDTTGTGIEDAIKIEAFIDGAFTALGQDASGADSDGSVMVLMVLGDLTAESSATIVPPGDSFTLSGTAMGSKVVEILIVGPQGGSGDGMNPANSEDDLPSGIVYEAASVSSDFSYSADIDVSEDADKGTYLVFVLSPGKNKRYDGLDDEDLLDGIADKYLGGDINKLASKTQEQINSILVDATTGAAGSDDFMKVLKIKVGTAEVQLYSIADVVIGDDMVIRGTSNREGHSIIVKVKGPIDLGTKFAAVENGKFKANFSTSEALTGEYTVEADDGEGHEDTTTVNIVMPVRTATSPTPAPTPTPMPTTPQEIPAPVSTPTAQPENSSTSISSKLPVVPGFEAIFVITALLVVYLFVLRRKRK